jgi:hypothetical protein
LEGEHGHRQRGDVISLITKIWRGYTNKETARLSHKPHKSQELWEGDTHRDGQSQMDTYTDRQQSDIISLISLISSGDAQTSGQTYTDI